MSELRPEFQVYVRSRSAGFVRLAWLLTGDAHDAEDLVQTALARAFQHWDRIAASNDIDAGRWTRHLGAEAGAWIYGQHRRSAS